jgi:CRP/FNR family transcriptional regulator, cyclic AMP receptor protein
MSEAVTDFLGTVALLRGMPADELAELAPALVRLELPAGEVLWRENDEARALMLIERGSVSASLTLPGGGEVELARMGPGEVLGEIPLLDGGRHTATARVLEPATLLALSRADFVALVARRHPTSFAVRRRLCAVVCLRLRRQLAALTATLHGERPAETSSAALAPAEAPARAYLRRLAFFRQLSDADLDEVLAAGTVALCPPGRTLVAEGASSPACHVTLNGAVEEVIVRGGRRIRVGLAGPGRAFGYESLLDGEPSPVTAATRERTLLLSVPAEAFSRLFGGSSEGSHAFLEALQRDLMAALRQAHRPHARLASQR